MNVFCESELTQLQFLLDTSRAHQQFTSILLLADFNHDENLVEELVQQVGVEDKEPAVLIIHELVFRAPFGLFLENLEGVLYI